MMDFLKELVMQPEFLAMLGAMALYLVDWYVTLTPNPFDNVILRAYKAAKKKNG